MCDREIQSHVVIVDEQRAIGRPMRGQSLASSNGSTCKLAIVGIDEKEFGDFGHG